MKDFLYDKTPEGALHRESFGGVLPGVAAVKPRVMSSIAAEPACLPGAAARALIFDVAAVTPPDQVAFFVQFQSVLVVAAAVHAVDNRLATFLVGGTVAAKIADCAHISAFRT
jgi:hypothetical protein